MNKQRSFLKRGLALFASLSLCLSLVQVPALAVETRTAQAHTHTYACRPLICEEEHIHERSCFAEYMPYTCGLEEGQAHTHNENRMTCTEIQVLTCTLAEHTHTDACTPTPLADVDVRPGDVEIPVESDPYAEQDFFGDEYTRPEFVVVGDDGIAHTPDEDTGDANASENENEGIELHDDDAAFVDETSDDGIASMDENADDGVASMDENDDDSAASTDENSDDDVASMDENGDSTASTDEDSDSDDGIASQDDSEPVALESMTEVHYQPAPQDGEGDVGYTCGLEEHQHTDACYQTVYMCRPMESNGCTCEYRCSPLVQKPWWDDDGNRIYLDYVTRTEDCPVCGGEDGDWQHSCEGKQVIADGNPTHNHNWATGFGIWGTIPANCTTPQAVTLLDMGCGAEWLFAFEKDSEIDPDTHYYSDYGSKAITDSKAATCTEDGFKTYMPCLLCGEVVTETIPATGHKLDENTVVIVKEANCLEDGLLTGHCTVCDTDVEEILPGGHVKPETGVMVIEATCTTDGHTVYTCTVCEEEIDEVTPALGHSWPTGDVSRAKEGICTTCGATAYEVYTYEDGATPSGNGYETHFCARVIQETDGEIYGVDKKDNRLDAETFTITINESLMGKVKSHTDKDGNTVMTYVAGYRNMDQYTDDSPLYKVGEEVSYADVPDMFDSQYGSWGSYYSTNDHKAIYLRDVREVVVDDFTVGMVPYQPAPSGYGRSVISATSEGIQKQAVYNDANHTVTITYTIPEDYAGSTVNIDASADVWAAFAQIQDTRWGYNGTQPGDSLGPVYIKLVNESGKPFAYDEGSFVVQSPSWTGETAYLGEINTFDGTTPPESAVPSRVSNGALRYLLNTTVDLKDEALNDASLSEKLIAKGYENGVEDLHQFYLDYYNHFYAESNGGPWSNLNEIPYGLLVQRDEGIFGGQSSSAAAPKPKETNPEVAGLGYSYAYTRLLSLVPGDAIGAKDLDGAYAVGNYMTAGSSVLNGFDSNANTAWNRLETGESGTLTGMSFYFNGEMNDFYQNTEYGIEVAFSLKEAPVQPQTTSLSVNKVWNDSISADQHNGVVVGLYNGDVLQEYVTLNAGNSWSHEWTGLAADGTWRVSEVSVPGYTSSQTQNGNAVTITNTPTTPPGTPDNPPPGDGNPPRDPDPTPTPPPVVTEIPDPNVPGAPEEVTVIDDDVPLTYVKTWDPEEEEFVYVPEDEVPLASSEPESWVPKTGDSSLIVLCAGLNVSALTGLGVLTLSNSRKKKEGLQ